MGPGLLLSESDMQVTTSIACDGARKILGTAPAMAGDYAYECYVWSTSQGDLTGLVSIGIAQPDSSLGAAVGKDAKSIGLWLADGLVKENDVTLGTVAAQGERVCIGVLLHLDPVSAWVEWYANGSLLYHVDLNTGLQWCLALGIGSGTAGDVSAAINAGANRFDCFGSAQSAGAEIDVRNGWSIARAGVDTVRLSIVSRGWIGDGSGGLPAHTLFAPYIIGAEKIVIRRAALPWWQRSGRAQSGAACTLSLDNSDGTFNALRDADARDAVVTLQRVTAGIAESSLVPREVYTGVIERVSEPLDGVVEIVLRDTLARLDRPLPMRYTRAFDATPNEQIPVALGVQRTLRPVLIDAPNRIYALGDAPMTNVTLVTDMGAPLDPNALPPQYVPALGQTGIALATDAVGRIGVDCSTVGQQYEIPGAADVLAGDGEFGTWAVAVNTYTDTPPSGWAWSGDASGATSALMKRVVSSTTIARIVSDVRWSQVGSPTYGEQLATTGTPLLAGRSYRITITVRTVIIRTDTTDDKKGGVRLVSALDFTQASAISSQVCAINEPGTYTFDYRVPLGASRALYIVSAASMSTGGSTIGQCLAEVSDIRVELLGQFQSLPLDGIAATDAFREILVNRAGEDAAIYSSADCASLPSYTVGFRFESAPNVLDAITQIADEFGAVLFTDRLGVIRIRTLDFSRAPVATFDASNILLGSVRIRADQPQSLTTNFGGRPNLEPFGDSDFVTDTDLVPIARRAALKMQSQILYSSRAPLAAEYEYALSAQRRHTRIDDAAQLATMANGLISLYSERRQVITLTVLYDDEIAPGLAPEDLLLGDVVIVYIPERGIIARNCIVIGTAFSPVAKRLEVTLWA